MNKKQNIKAVDVRIKQLVVELEKHEKDSDGYATILNNINKLSETRKVLAPDPNPQSKLNMNTVFSGACESGRCYSGDKLRKSGDHNWQGI